MNNFNHISAIKKAITVLLITIGVVLTACSKVTISNLHTQVSPQVMPSEIAGLKKFNLLPIDHDEPFSEQLALDAVIDNLLARGYQLNSDSPDFLVVVWFDHSYQAESHLRLAAPTPFGWYHPGFGRYRHWPGYSSPMRTGGYTLINNYITLAIAFVRPDSLSTIKENQGNPDTKVSVPNRDILWLGQGYIKSSRNAFLSLSCLSAGILEEFPNSVQASSKGIELTQCY